MIYLQVWGGLLYQMWGKEVLQMHSPPVSLWSLLIVMYNRQFMNAVTYSCTHAALHTSDHTTAPPLLTHFAHPFSHTLSTPPLLMDRLHHSFNNSLRYKITQPPKNIEVHVNVLKII